MERSSYKTCQTGTTSNCHFVKSPNVFWLPPNQRHWLDRMFSWVKKFAFWNVTLVSYLGALIMTVSAAFCNSWITLKNGFGLVARKWPSLRICLHFSSATYFMWGQQVDFSCCMILKSSDRSAFDYLILILASVSPLAVWQRVGRERMIHAISCLVNTPGTRLTLNTLMPACPFYQPRATIH